MLIDVSQGESGASIAKDLANNGVVKSSTAFYRLAVSDIRSSSISPGLHRIDRKICAKEALNQLLDRTRIENLISIAEGQWNSEIHQRLIEIGFSKREIARVTDSVRLPSGFTSTEGLLFPAQYSFDSDTALSEIMTSMIDRGEREIRKADFFKGTHGFSAQELLIIASLIQAEGGPQDFTKISQVIRNRLKIGMPLQFDSTVHYVMKSRGDIFLSARSTLINSPYNTYRKSGLPPTPINNPGAAALFAATHPEQGPWLYFITVAPDDTRFTASYQEFLEWKSLYRKNLRAGMFGSR